MQHLTRMAAVALIGILALVIAACAPIEDEDTAVDDATTVADTTSDEAEGDTPAADAEDSNGTAAAADGAEVADADVDPAALDSTVQVDLNEFTFDPDPLQVPADTSLTFELANSGAIPHDMVIVDVAESEIVQAGQTGTFEVDPLEEGEYEIICTEAGHEDAGMVTTMTVVGGAAAETADAGADSDPNVDADHPDHDHAAMDTDDMTPAEMAAMHDDLSHYPVETEGLGNQPMEPEIDDDGVKVFELTAEHVEWETEPGEVLEGMAYNGEIPGPRIDVDLGDTVRLILHNELEVPTALHLHGLVLPQEMDGVPGLTQDSVLPGESFTYELEVNNAGSHMYHSHFDSAFQVPSGLLGAFIVHDPEDQEVDHDLVMILNDGPLGYTINGKGFPATEPIVVDQGDTVRVRYMNEGLTVHPMHLHGMPQQVVARDGYPLDAPYYEDNILISPGDRVDAVIEATEPGAWAWHCHILTHAEGSHGMFGMVTALIVE